MNCDVLVVGGGSTGTGVARDLAMRGLRVVLAERGDLATGTTGRYHGLLHSGTRYAVSDPRSARECIEENRILRRIAAHCIEDTGGTTALLPGDEPAYVDLMLAGCRSAGIPCEELSPAAALRREPLLSRDVARAFAVPDAALEPFLLVNLNAASATAHGATILTYHEVVGVERAGDRVVGARLRDRHSGEERRVHCTLLVAAAGAWAGRVAALARVELRMTPAKGTMLIYNHRLVRTIVHRCRRPSDGDIVVPIGTVCIAGTTSVQVDDPDRARADAAEVKLLMREGAAMVPALASARVLRAYAGVRPLYQDRPAGAPAREVSASAREVSRSFALLDHAERDGVEGFISIVGGKLTTYRKMAEEAANLACRKLGVTAPCRTAQEPLPGVEPRRYHAPGDPLAAVEAGGAGQPRHGELVCECELVTAGRVREAIRRSGRPVLDDVRRLTRLGMGPCQAGFCGYRAAAMLSDELAAPAAADSTGAAATATSALAEFLQARWRGVHPVLWGDQLRQAWLGDWIYRGLLNLADVLETPGASDGS